MPSPKPVGLIRRVWFNWKALRLPWRKRFLIGFDLSGASFWEFKDTLSSNSNRMRRIVEYPSSVHYSEVRISPQWHQWLRHTRADAPSIAEQSQDLVRQANLKILAAEADARWAAKPSFLDAPNKQQTLPAMNIKDPGGYAPPTEPQEKQGVRNAVGGGLEDDIPGTYIKTKELLETDEPQSSTGEPKLSRKATEENPWKKARGGPSEEWTPQAWDPNATGGR